MKARSLVSLIYFIINTSILLDRPAIAEIVPQPVHIAEVLASTNVDVSDEQLVMVMEPDRAVDDSNNSELEIADGTVN